VRLKPLPPPDFLEFTLGENTCVITDDGGGLALALAQALMQESWTVVLLRFPQAVIENEMLPLPSPINHVTLDNMHEEHLAERLAAIADTYGPVGALVHVHPVWKHEPTDDGGQTAWKRQQISPALAPSASEAILSHVFLMAKHLKPSLTAAARESRHCFMTVTQLDGALGISQEPGAFKATSGLAAGGLAGLIKTLDLEWGDVFCRAVDLMPDLDGTRAVQAILAELHDPNRLVLEVGYGPMGRVTLEATEDNNGGKPE
jgi:NAD(P)-dependent dehydrogenase (short-subunit alcohol dehydrogenase family)